MIAPTHAHAPRDAPPAQERIDIRNYALNVLATKGQQLQARAHSPSDL